MWLRRPVPPEQRNFFYRGFNRVYQRLETRLRKADRRDGAAQRVMVGVVALVIIAAAGYGLTRVPTGFLPIEDQGYLLVAVQLPDGAALERTRRRCEQVSEIAKRRRRASIRSSPSPACRRSTTARRSPTPASPTSSSRTGASARRAGPRSALYKALNENVAAVEDGRVLVIPPPPIQGIGNAAGVTMQIELRDGSFDWPGCRPRQCVVDAAATQSVIQRMSAPFRARRAPIQGRGRPREGRRRCGSPLDQVFSALGELSRLELRQPVQQVRPRIPGLCPG